MSLSHILRTTLGRVGIMAIAMMFVLVACGPAEEPAEPTPTPDEPAAESPDESPDESPGNGEPEVEPPGTDRVTVNVGIPQLIFSFMPLYIADAKGFWDEENLDVELIFFASGSEAQQAVLGDAVMIGAGGYTEPIIVQAQGVETRLFGFIQDTLPYHLIASPDITSIDELEGKVLGVSREGALSDQVTRIALTKAGFDPNLATYQAAGGSPARWAALQSGAIDASVLDSPTYFLALDEGYVSLIDFVEELPGFPYEVLYAKADTMDANHDVFLRFMRGYIKGARYGTDPANRDEVIQIAAEYLEAEEEVVARGYDDSIEDFPPDGAPTLQGIEDALDGTKEFADIEGIDQVTAEGLYYPDLVEEALASLEAYP